MFTTTLKRIDFYRKIPKDLTEASLSVAGLSIAAALFMVFLFGMELSNFLRLRTSTYVVVDDSADSEYLRLVFNISFPALSCEFASVDVSDVLGTYRPNIKNTLYKQHIDPHSNYAGEIYKSKPPSRDIKHGDDIDEEIDEGSVSLTAYNFDQYSHRHQILVVNFYVPWCFWSNRLKPSWEKAATIMRERYDPDKDGRILLGKVDCTVEKELCKRDDPLEIFRHHIQAYPSIRIFRRENARRDENGHHDHESYYGHQDTDSLADAMQSLVPPMPSESQKLNTKNKSDDDDVAEVKMPAPSAGGCRIAGYVRVKMVPGNLIISARSRTHSFDASQMNMSHVISRLSFGRKLDRGSYIEATRLMPNFGENFNRLKDRSFINDHAIGQNVTIEHYIQVVKREMVNADGDSVISDYEYTAHSSIVESIDIPVAKFHYEFSPMQVLVTEEQKSYSHFIVNICAIIGGVFTVAGILDSIFHNTVKLGKKMGLNKIL